MFIGWSTLLQLHLKNQDTWTDPLVITDVIWESVLKTTKPDLIGYCHQSQTDHISMYAGDLMFVLVKNNEAYYVNLSSGDKKLLIIYPDVWHSVVNLYNDEAVFINMAKRHSTPAKNDFIQSTSPVSLNMEIINL
ncbi:hypothetical protein HC766_05355 [Candidatus Gracilibacteria bacterium]|nr:hypothetical protein [Candidatus Gracilibacteria bacterium]